MQADLMLLLFAYVSSFTVMTILVCLIRLSQYHFTLHVNL